MNAVLKKLRFKGQSPVLLLDAPPEFAPVAKDFGVPVHREAKGEYPCAVAFVKSLAEAKTAAKAMKKALAEAGIFWLATPRERPRSIAGSTSTATLPTPR